MACFMLVNIIFAQSEKKNIVKTNILSPALRAYHLNYERAFSEKLSGQLGLMYFGGFNSGDVKLNGYGITPEVRLYPKGTALEGFFLGLSPRYQSYQLKSDGTDVNGNTITDKATLSSIGAGLVLGGQWIFADIVSLEVYGGPAFNSRTLKIEDNSGGTNFEDVSFGNGFSFRLGVTVGVAF